MDWEFLLHILKLFGFLEIFCSLIRQYITTTWFSVTLNGISKGFFKGGRGLREGDPISLYLFILVEEIFSRMIKRQVELLCPIIQEVHLSSLIYFMRTIFSCLKMVENQL